MRLHYVDMVRGLGLLYMLVFQILEMYSQDVDLSGNFYWLLGRNYFSWFSVFMVIAGFSIVLMFEKYQDKQFFTKAFWRLIRFIIIGYFLVFWCQFQVATVFDEVVSAIGLNLMILSPFLFLSKYMDQKARPIYFATCCVLFAVLNHTFHLEGAFNIFWCLSFMFVGVLLAQLSSQISWLLIGFVFIALSFVGETPNMHLRNIQYWFSSCGVICFILLATMFLQEVDVVRKFLSYFGKHTLFFYFFHFAIFRFALLITGWWKSWNLYEGLALTLASILVLVCLQKLSYPLKQSLL